MDISDGFETCFCLIGWLLRLEPPDGQKIPKDKAIYKKLSFEFGGTLHLMSRRFLGLQMSPGYSPFLRSAFVFLTLFQYVYLALHASPLYRRMTVWTGFMGLSHKPGRQLSSTFQDQGSATTTVKGLTRFVGIG